MDYERDLGRLRRLGALLPEHYPWDGVISSDQDAWPGVSRGLVSHAARSARSIVILGEAGEHVDAGRLTRSLFDHAVTLAWLAIDPVPHLGAWRKGDVEERLKAADHAAKIGVELSPADQIAEWKRQFDEPGIRKPLGMADRAVAADTFWGSRVSAIEPKTERSFTGLYVTVFRRFSGSVHATPLGLNQVTEDLVGHARRVHLADEPLTIRPAYAAAAVTFALGLLVASQTLGFPDEQAVFEAYQHGG